MTDKQNIVIVGGGTAGWLAAARMGAALADHASITLVESPTVPTIGVGEGTWPSMRTTLQSAGIAERDLLTYCEASLKQGTLFKGWVTGDAGDSYMHPFSLPADYSSLNLAEWWRDRDDGPLFCHAVTPQAAIASAKQAPKQSGMPDYAFALNYGYHLDAGKFAELLHKHSTENLGVTHVMADVVDVISDSEGFIGQIKLSDESSLTADLFIDCTGQKALLIGEHLASEFVSLRDSLPNNRAIVTQVPYAHADDDIASCTLSTAQDYGWIWDIGLQTRRGVGYVHDADMISEDAATATLLNYVKETSGAEAARTVKTRAVRFEPGYRPEPWRGNCVAIGLSAGFIEPLEASALAMIEQGVSMLIENFPRSTALLAPATRLFNKKMQEHWASIQEFLLLHYALNQRNDTDYWRQARSMERMPQGLSDKLMLWQTRAPFHSDAPRIDELFPAASYQYVWLGMNGHVSNREPCSGRMAQPTSQRIDSILHEVREKTLQLQQALPTNRALLNAMVRQTPVVPERR